MISGDKGRYCTGVVSCGPFSLKAVSQCHFMDFADLAQAIDGPMMDAWLLTTYRWYEAYQADAEASSQPKHFGSPLPWTMAHAGHTKRGCKSFHRPVYFELILRETVPE